MSEINLNDRFPDMTPIRKTPALGTINGIGLTINGSRDHDPETGTYVATHCFSVLFIPVFAIGAYRVARAEEGGWYFLGKEPLSVFAKGWNCLVIVSVLAGIGFGWRNSHTGTPEYAAGQKLAQAETLAGDGSVAEAAELYREVATGTTNRRQEAQRGLREMLLGDGMEGVSLGDLASVFEIAVDLQRQNLLVEVDLAARAVQLVGQRADADPAAALSVLDAATRYGYESDELKALRRRYLEALVARDANDIAAASRLAVICEADGDMEKCQQLLLPLEDRLGDTEGARILGQIYAAEGEFEKSHALLGPYTEQRLARLHAAEQDFENAFTTAQERVIGQLEKGEAPESFYQKYNTSSSDQQNVMVQEYMADKIKDDPEIAKTQESLQRAAEVVPVALALGFVLLRRAQEMDDPQARQAELEKAEKTFLAIRGVAGESDQYRLYLGQVYYWLGKQDEGRQLFDELLEAKGRGFDTLTAVAQVLREVGAATEFRSMIEEAYGSTSEQQKKQTAAFIRSLSSVDVDDQILWLGRSDTSNLSVKAMLSSALGNKAMTEGKEQDAANHLREAIKIHESQPETADLLNNLSLVYRSLAHVTGDRNHCHKAAEMLEKAVALSPSDSILLHNAASAVMESALWDITGEVIDFTKVKGSADLSLIGFLCRSSSDYETYRERLKTDPKIARVVVLRQNSLVLAPRRAVDYDELADIYRQQKDVEALRTLLERVEATELDFEDVNRPLIEHYGGQSDAKGKAEAEGRLAGFRKAVDATRTSGGPTFAVAVEKVFRRHAFLYMIDEPIDCDQLVQLAEEAHTASPSSGTYGILIAALLTRASTTCAQSSPAYAEHASKYRRSLGPSHLIALLLSSDEESRKPLLENADVQRVIQLMIEKGKSFPNEWSFWDWAMFRHADPKQATAVAEALGGDEVRRVLTVLKTRLAPLAATPACDRYWMLQVDGKQDEANAVLREAADRGVPIPVDF